VASIREGESPVQPLSSGFVIMRRRACFARLVRLAWDDVGPAQPAL
jgi:hypothetical protein